jgi:hypothetical protein
MFLHRLLYLQNRTKSCTNGQYQKLLAESGFGLQTKNGLLKFALANGNRKPTNRDFIWYISY